MNQTSLQHVAARRLGARVPKQPPTPPNINSRSYVKPVIKKLSAWDKVKNMIHSPMRHNKTVWNNMNMFWRLVIFIFTPILFAFNTAHFAATGINQLFVFVSVSVLSVYLMGSVVVGVIALLAKLQSIKKSKGLAK